MTVQIQGTLPGSGPQPSNGCLYTKYFFTSSVSPYPKLHPRPDYLAISLPLLVLSLPLPVLPDSLNLPIPLLRHYTNDTYYSLCLT